MTRDRHAALRSRPEREGLRHPELGRILFSAIRSATQCRPGAALREVAGKELLLASTRKGGRFSLPRGFSLLPELSRFGQLYARRARCPGPGRGARLADGKRDARDRST